MRTATLASGFSLTDGCVGSILGSEDRAVDGVGEDGGVLGFLGTEIESLDASSSLDPPSLDDESSPSVISEVFFK